MASRGRRVPASPFASKLRDIELATRSRRTSPAVATGVAVKGCTTATTGETGVATWVFPWSATVAPVISATAQSDTPATVTVSAVSPMSVTVAVWDVAGAPVANATVHVVAYA